MLVIAFVGLLVNLVGLAVLHGGHKTGIGGEKRQAELKTVLERHGTPEAREQFEWMLRNPARWPSLRRWKDVTAMLRRNGLPESVAAALIPGLWSIPRNLHKDWLSDWAQTL